VNDLDLAKLSHDSYSLATHIKGNAAALLTEADDSLVIAFRGTNDAIDVMADIWAIPWKPAKIGAWVHRGFWLYLEPLVDWLDIEIHRYNLPVHLTGHSLGGAAACLFAAICECRGLKVSSLTTFGAPRPGYESLARITSNIEGKRYVIDGDQVTSVPPSWFAFPYCHDREETLLDGIDGIIDHPIKGYIDRLGEAALPENKKKVFEAP